MTKKPMEASIVINGKTLSEAQAMTARVALTHFVIDMERPGSLGADKMGEDIRIAYLARAKEILQLIHEDK